MIPWGIKLGTVSLTLAIGAAISPPAQDRSRPLEQHFIDVEGGAATLIVTPAGESVLLDAGWGDVGGRDARRIQAATQRARVPSRWPSHTRWWRWRRELTSAHE